MRLTTLAQVPPLPPVAIEFDARNFSPGSELHRFTKCAGPRGFGFSPHWRQVSRRTHITHLEIEELPQEFNRGLGTVLLHDRHVDVIDEYNHLKESGSAREKTPGRINHGGFGHHLHPRVGVWCCGGARRESSPATSRYPHDAEDNFSPFWAHFERAQEVITDYRQQPASLTEAANVRRSVPTSKRRTGQKLKRQTIDTNYG